jgi:restriction endonuclease Mrr
MVLNQSKLTKNGDGNANGDSKANGNGSENAIVQAEAE